MHTLRIQRTLTFQADAGSIIDAWCDPAVQARIAEGAAEPAGEQDGVALWHLHTVLGPPRRVRLKLEARDARSARHRAEGDSGLQVLGELSTLPARGGAGIEATLEVTFQDDALDGPGVAHLDPAPVLLAGQALRRLRACVDPAPAAIADQAPSAKPGDPAPSG